MKFAFNQWAGRAQAGLLSFVMSAVTSAHAAPAANPFAEIIRSTEALTPQQEQKAFHLPPGFEIELVASEPAIGKPINMAFDGKGQLWISQSREYPFPAPDDKPARDAIQVLSDFAQDGHARKITKFASGLNIPIGLYPYKDGALAYSIPNIYQFRDTNHDGAADTKEKILGTFGFNKDTHGMTSSFRRGYDGWMYANHGFNNTSVLTAKDGSTITMTSGNTYRVRLDGSHVEQFAWGRVNPFGLFFDPLGNLYSADCETLPIYEIFRGGWYPSFGRPDDGLGFAPSMMDHKHGSTAIAGIVYYAATNFPPEFRENIFVGNVMTCRIDRDSLEMHGSSPWAVEKPDFLSTDDPWFRPVDIQLGPDGALYIADFYNRIIGHYEVPLSHPGRDRERGRIWRIVYKGTNAPAKISPPQDFDLSRQSAKKLVKTLASENLTVRMLATTESTDRIGKPASEPLKKMMRNKKSTVFQKIHGLWALYRLGTLDPQILADAAQDCDYRLRIHALKVYAETPSLSDEQQALLVKALTDGNPLVERAAVDALGQHPRFADIRPMLDARERVPAGDTHLLYVLRVNLRNELLPTNTLAKLPLSNWSEQDERAIADVCPGTPTADSATFLLRHLQHYDESKEKANFYLRHIARYLPEAQIGELVSFTKQKFADDIDLEMTLFNSVEEGTAQRGGTVSTNLQDWGMYLARQLYTAVQNADQNWQNTPVEGIVVIDNPWSLEKRNSSDGDTNSTFISSLPAGEKMTGILRSRSFAAPEKLSFFVAGHDGFPDKPLLKKNAVRLRDAITHEILAETLPPRKDIAQPITWDLSKNAGRQSYLEIEDANNAGAFAWLAVGRFQPEVVPLPTVDPRAIGNREQEVAKLARTYQLTGLEPQLTEWITNRSIEPATRAAAAVALISMEPDESIILIGRICQDSSETAYVREKMADALATIHTAKAQQQLMAAMKVAPDRLQVKIALALAGTKEGANSLLTMMEHGGVSPRVLMARAFKERLAAVGPDNYQERVEKLMKGLPPANEELQKVLDARRKNFDPSKASAELGAKVFSQNCMVCHSMDNRGGAVGPHLDGIGNRGLERLIEDVLDPSRNVDPSFRYSTVILKNGDVFNGLLRREEGAVLVFVDATGKEISVAKSDIDKRVESTASLMPDNFADAIPIADFNNLMAFLLSKGSGGQQVKK